MSEHVIEWYNIFSTLKEYKNKSHHRLFQTGVIHVVDRRITREKRLGHTMPCLYAHILAPCPFYIHLPMHACSDFTLVSQGILFRYKVLKSTKTYIGLRHGKYLAMRVLVPWVATNRQQQPSAMGFAHVLDSLSPSPLSSVCGKHAPQAPSGRHIRSPSSEASMGQ